MNYIFIDSKDKVDMVGVVENDNLVEFYIEEKENKKTLGNIYRARVDTILKGMEAAFVDIGEEKNAYLYVKQALNKEQMYQKKDYNINQVLKEGQDIIVQVVKEASGTKGAKVTTHIELKGRYIVLTPYSKNISISKKIYKKEDTNRLKKISEEIIQDNVGFIFRTASKNTNKNKIKEEYNILLNIYNKIEREKNFLPCPKLIYSEPDIAYQIVRESYNENTQKIKVNNEKYYKKLMLMEENYPFKFSHKLELDKDFSVSLDRKLSRDINNAFNRKVELENGAYLIIDQLEALTVIDVNTGKFTGKSSLKDTILKTNIYAAEEIARQIRLRDIGGIIVVDFIDMRSKKDEEDLLLFFKRQLQKDRNKANIIDITKLGLVEMTRRKSRKSLTTKYYSICPKCNGIGKIFVDI